MTATSSKATKRLSSFFSLGRDDSASNVSRSSNTSSHRADSPQDAELPGQSPARQKLVRQRVISPSSIGQPPLDSAFQPLDPPPLFTDARLTRPFSRDGSASLPNSAAASPQGSRDGSRSRPQTPNFLAPPGHSSRPATPDSANEGKRKSWLPGKTPKGATMETGYTEPKAWIAGLTEHVPYDLIPLLSGSKVPELWNEQGDTSIYLFPQTSSKGASFRIDSRLFADSRSLGQLVLSRNSNTNIWQQGPGGRNLLSGMQDISINPAPQSYDSAQLPLLDRSTSNPYIPYSSYQPREEKTLYLPLELEGDYSDWNLQPQGDDLELLVLYRNFFAFVSGGALISTPRQVSLYSIFIGISSILKRYHFTNGDDATYGQVVSSSFTRYCSELRLADVRSSREKTIEAIVLGEYMRCWPLYNEGFVHAAGRLDDIKSVHSPKFARISAVTANRLERAGIDIQSRLSTLLKRLEDFDFPSMFSGIANSQTSAESKLVRFKEWKLAFTTFRRHVIAHYRHKYGAWPPKANSKQRNIGGRGINRLLCKQLYSDFTDLYDMLVDRHSITTRTIDLLPLSDDIESHDLTHSMRHALRQVESEYDRSDVPVYPPIPYDVPLLPTFTQSFNPLHATLPDNSGRSTRKLPDNEVNEILLGSYNRESMKATPWVQDFINYERRMGSNKTLDEIVDMRIGQWLFVYAILQLLPMVVVDARDLQFTEGVEYFLCIPSRGGRPWMKEDNSQSRAWYNVANGSGIVSLPADLVDHSVEGIYRRSHCWTVAAKWAQESGALSPDVPHPPDFSLQPPPMFPGQLRQSHSSPHLSPHISPNLSPNVSPNSRPVSPATPPRPLSRISNRSSIALGLEATNPPSAPASRPVTVFNPNTTFDSILGSSQLQLPQGKKRRKESRGF